MKNQKFLLRIILWVTITCGAFLQNGYAQALQISYPIDSNSVSSGFGQRLHPITENIKHHNGVDIAANAGTPIVAIGPGRVIFAGSFSGYGLLVVIAHTNLLSSHYGHCSSLNVKVGQVVQAGQNLGKVGSTGVSTGPHLHFEVRKDGSPINPEILFPALRDKAEG